MRAMALKAIAPALTAWSFTSAALAQPVQSSADIQGVWQLPRPTAQFSVEIKATTSGATLKVTRVTQRCTFVVEPTGTNGDFKGYPIRGNCTAGTAKVEHSGDDIVLTLHPSWGVKPLKMVKVGGPDSSDRRYPNIAMRGVEIGMPIKDAVSTIRQNGMTAKYVGSSGFVLGNVQGLQGTYTQAYTDYSGEFAGTQASEDVIGLFQVEGDTNTGVAVLLRRWGPSPQTAPTVDGFLEAMSGAYGQPQNVQKSSRLIIWSWYFGLDGQPATGATLVRCKKRPGKENRVAMIQFDKLTFIPNTPRAREEGASVRSDLSPQSGCGYTLRYKVNANENGSLQSAEAVFYDHRVIANQIWDETSKELDALIKRNLENIAASGNNASKL